MIKILRTQEPQTDQCCDEDFIDWVGKHVCQNTEAAFKHHSCVLLTLRWHLNTRPALADTKQQHCDSVARQHAQTVLTHHPAAREQSRDYLVWQNLKPGYFTVGIIQW